MFFIRKEIYTKKVYKNIVYKLLFAIMLTGPRIKHSAKSELLHVFFVKPAEEKNIYSINTVCKHIISTKGSFSGKIFTWGSGHWCMNTNPHSWALTDWSVTSGTGLTMMPECRCRTKRHKLTEN